MVQTKKNNRVKAEAPLLLPVGDWVHADQMIRRIGSLQRRIEERQNKADERIDKIKHACGKSIRPLQETIELNVLSLQAFAESRQAEFGKVRSKKLDFGILGWRKSTAIRIGDRTKDLIKEFFTGNKLKQTISIKETVSKEGLAKLTDEELARVEARRDIKDDFYVEPDRLLIGEDG
jgi:phage host-nuclease inhibitor protein Gam